MKESQKGWIILEWGKEIDCTPNILSQLPKSANGVRENGGWESIFCCGKEECPHCVGNRNRGHSEINLMEEYSSGIAVKVDDLLRGI